MTWKWGPNLVHVQHSMEHKQMSIYGATTDNVSVGTYLF